MGLGSLGCSYLCPKVSSKVNRLGEKCWTDDPPASRTKTEIVGSSVRRFAMTFPAVPPTRRLMRVSKINGGRASRLTSNYNEVEISGGQVSGLVIDCCPTKNQRRIEQ